MMNWELRRKEKERAKEGGGGSVESISRNGDADDSQLEIVLQADICGSPSEYVDSGSSQVGELKIDYNVLLFVWGWTAKITTN